MPETRPPGRRAGLTREGVLAAARDLLAEGGLDALTMRALAGRLGVAPNALYSHVARKTALVDDLLDAVLGEVAAPEPAGAGEREAREALESLLRSTYEVLLAHPDLVPVYLARQGARGPNARRLGAVMTELLGRAGVRGPAAEEALRVLVVHTLGFAAYAGGRPGEPGEPPVARELVSASHARGLRWLLAGITAGGA